ncbi:efflux RND transporter permease subunit [Aliidiomarina maris]|uniref:Multidrug efflux pump subunit AcrB n=2 Tax=Aliidiomarina maris TaxID=531312 RepID=A0A327X3J9_9GAMM|nr:efflux RND transporter permease subunit [Aliidiomarina maris]RAK01700.1 multidrug efflux pump subunit AcrB [Aliidiomarina maris]
MMQQSPIPQSPQTGIIAWFTRNTVAANLLMALIIIGGIMSVLTIRKQMFPTVELNMITIQVPFPGAAPQEVEQGVIIRIEDALDNTQGIKNIRSTAREGLASISIEIENDYTVQEVMDEVRMRVDSITSFPAQIEPPNVYRTRQQRQVIWLSIYGDIDERARKQLAKEVRDDLRSFGGISQVDVVGARDYEIAVEVSEQDLQRYGLSFNDVVNAIRGTSLDVPGGSIRTPNGDILLRARNQGYVGDDYSQIVLLRRDDGTRLLLGDIAQVQDGFIERRGFAEFDGMPSTLVRVQSVGDQSDLDIAAQVKRYVERKGSELPAGVQVAYWGDSSYYLQGRLDLMLNNMYVGILLVFLALSLFLQIRLAFWVMVGLPVCFLGAFMLMQIPAIDVSVNMISLFGFILVLGIVVDDAIIIGESAYSEIEQYGKSEENVIRGVKRVAIPATFGVLTTIVAFMPMLMVDGAMAGIWQSIAWVVVLCLGFSLVESKLILPAHINKMKFSRTAESKQNRFQRFRNGFSNQLKRFVETKYRPFATKCVEYRYTTIAAFVAMMILVIGLIGSGAVRWVMFPNIPSDFVQMNLEMQPGTNEDRTIAALDQIREAIYQVDANYYERYQEHAIRHVNSFISGSDGGTIFVELEKGEAREIDGFAIVNQWRELVPEMVGVKAMNFQGSIGGGGGYDIEFMLSGSDLDQLASAALDLRTAMADYDGVFDISDTFGAPQEEIQLRLLPAADSLGITLQDLATQVRFAFFGAEAQRIQRDDEEVRVMVRYPLSERRSIGNLEAMRIRTADGREVPFNVVAEAVEAEGYSTIGRVNGVRAVNVRARVDKDNVEPFAIIRDLRAEHIPSILERHPNVRLGLEGASQEEQDALGALAVGFIFAMFGIYALIAIPLKSYSQPLIIMSVIPFGIIGAVVGHLVLGMPVSILSLFGIIALAGVVVNDSLILVDYVNQSRQEGQNMRQAVVDAGCARFRAIVLTSLTTFAGLLPIVLERSMQAQLVIPMAISLAFGILFATVITLLLIPCLYIVLEDIKNIFRPKTNNTHEPVSST